MVCFTRSEKLDEMDIDVSETAEDAPSKSDVNQSQAPPLDDDMLSSSQSNVKVSQDDDNEEFVIEDYDD